MQWTVIDLSQAWDTLRCHDLITQDWYSYAYDTDEVLHARSALQFLREADQLTATEVSALDAVDAFWQTHPKAFNEHFRHEHEQHDPTTALTDWVEDANGNPAPIPDSHWWWHPLRCSDMRQID